VAEAKQLAALQALLGLTAGPEAGFLGSSWLIVLRCVSALDALKVRDHVLHARADYVQSEAVLLTARLLTVWLSTAVPAGLLGQASM
jgi:hypothetical protein